LDRMVGEGGAVGYEQQLGQQQLGGQQPYGGMGQMVQQMLSLSMGMPQLGLSGAHAYAKHILGLGSLSGPGSPSVGGSSASMSGSGSASASGSRRSLPTSVSTSLTGGSGSGMVDNDGARRSPLPLSYAYQLHAQGQGLSQGQKQDITQSRNLFVGNVSSSHFKVLIHSSSPFIRSSSSSNIGAYICMGILPNFFFCAFLFLCLL